MDAAIYLPKILKIGAGSSKRLAQLCIELGFKKPLIVTDPAMVELGYLKRITTDLSDSNIAFGVFADCVPDPTTTAVNEGVIYCKSDDYDCLVALGGGSAIDTAKAIAILARHGGEIKDFKAPNPVPEGLPVIAIPTTAGTGSEATRVMVITDTHSQEKMMCLGIGALPVAALVDYEFTLTMPYRLTADTGLDSLCHALEAYVSKKANAFTDPIALACMKNIAQNLPLACEDPNNLKAKEAMMLAATQGGMAFSNASVTLIHGMSRPIGAAFHVPHGMSNAMLLPVVTEYSIPGAKVRYVEAAKVMGMACISDSDDQAIGKLLDGLYQLCEDLKVPSPKDYGIDKDDYFNALDLMADQALASGSPNNNPVVPSKADIIRLYEKVWG
ncbi:MAG: iron-containing alcohol dehydrogenase [Algicola sp.]|nr:iron-containing alcohol dehydrogenase [Algicola sp.]